MKVNEKEGTMKRKGNEKCTMSWEGKQNRKERKGIGKIDEGGKGRRGEE